MWREGAAIALFHLINKFLKLQMLLLKNEKVGKHKKNWDEMSTNLFQNEATLKEDVQDLGNKWDSKYKYINDNNALI